MSYDDEIKKLPIPTIELFKNSLIEHLSNARYNHKYISEFENMIKNYETFIMNDKIKLEQHARTFMRSIPDVDIFI